MEFSRTTRRRVTAIAAVTVGLVSSMLIAGVSSAAPVPGASITGSTFEGIDGDLSPVTSPSQTKSDWDGTALSNVSRSQQGDIATGATDNSFAGGIKEDTTALSFVTGSIPSNKSDLTNLRVATENASVEGANIYLHMAWERAQALGSANMDFEFNQNSCVLTSTGAVAAGSSCQSTLYKIPNRKAGDMLIAYDFGGNSGTVDLGVYRWLDSTLQAGDPLLALGCEASSSLPCWSKRQNLSTIGARGEISTDTKFGEASINLNTLLGSSTCTAFGSVYLKSRSSSSFTAQMKDFIAPLSASVSNCHVKSPGRIDIVKDDDADAPVAATFQLFSDRFDTDTNTNVPDAPVAGKVCSTTTTSDANATPPVVAGRCSITGIDPGNGGSGTGTWYWVVEGSWSNATPPVFTPGAPAGYAADPNGIQRRIQVMDSSSNTYPMAFENPRLYKIVVLVCDQTTSSLVASGIQAFGASSAATSPASSALTAAQQAAACGLTGSTTYSGTKHALNDISGVDIP